MKKLFLLMLTVICTLMSAQQKNKDYANIVKSKNIYEINAFLRDAHPDDPRRSIMKPRVMDMMREYIQYAKPGDPKVRQMQDWLALLKRRSSTKITFEEMNENIKKKQIAKYQKQLQVGQAAIVYKPSSPQNVFAVSPSKIDVAPIPDTEASEFNSLMAENPSEHKNKTVKILNSLFDNDPNSKECIVMIENKSDCNIIVRIEGVGNTKYRLPVPAHSDNSIVVAKGDYLMTSLVCGAQFASQKSIHKPLMVALGSSK